MQEIFFERTESPVADIFCPHCQAGLDIRWETEYGDPQIGDHDVLCPACQNTMRLQVRIDYCALKI